MRALQRILSARDVRVIPAMPLDFKKPPEGASVLFWTHFRLSPEATTRGNAVKGEFRDDTFWAGSDHWSLNEVSHWALCPAE